MKKLLLLSISLLSLSSFALTSFDFGPSLPDFDELDDAVQNKIIQVAESKLDMTEEILKVNKIKSGLFTTRYEVVSTHCIVDVKVGLFLKTTAGEAFCD